MAVLPRVQQAAPHPPAALLPPVLPQVIFVRLIMVLTIVLILAMFQLVPQLVAPHLRLTGMVDLVVIHLVLHQQLRIMQGQVLPLLLLQALLPRRVLLPLLLPTALLLFI